MNAGIYIRVSSQEQAAEDKSSIPNQIRDCEELCKRKEYTIFDKYIDAGYSSKRKDRPEYQRLISDLRAGHVKGVVAWKWDRLGAGRGIYPLMDAVEESPFTIETVHEGVISPLMLSMLTSFRAQVLKDKKDRLISAGASRLKQGKAYGGYYRFGYDYSKETGTWAINEYEAGWVKQIFAWYLEGVAVREIRRKLIKAGVPQKQGYAKRPWTPPIIRDMLKNPAYTGRLVVNWNGRPYELTLPAIVDTATFQKAQAKMAHNNAWRDHNKKLDYLLSGLLRCGHCGSTWRCWGRRFKYRNGERSLRNKPSRYYQCGIGGYDYEGECPHKRAINANILEPVVWRAIEDFANNPGDVEERIQARIEELKATHDQRQAEAEKLKDRLNGLQEERQWCILQARKGIITQADFEGQLAMLDIEQAECLTALQEAQLEVGGFGLDHEVFFQAIEQIATEIKTFQELDIKGKRRVLETLVDEIVIHPDRGTLELHGTLERVIQFKEGQARMGF